MILEGGSGDNSTRVAELDLLYLSCQGDLIEKLIKHHGFEEWESIPAQHDGDHPGFLQLLHEATGRMCVALCGLEEPSWEEWCAGGKTGSLLETMFDTPSR